MGLTKDMIIVEDRLQEVFNYLPPHIDSKNREFPIFFSYGDKKELNAYLKNHKNPYPLIWLIYPYEENHQKTRVELSDVKLILATKTTSKMLNKERIDKTFKTILIPLFNNIKKLFTVANIISFEDEYNIVKHPNYSETDDSEENATTDIWDAMTIELNGNINNVCLREIKKF